MYKLFARAREPMNSCTHFIGALLSVLGAVLIVLRSGSLAAPDPVLVGASLVFAFSTLALYSTSAYYHYYNKGDADVQFRLRKLDHSMIYVLIAGSYTPMVLGFFPRDKAVVFTAAIWCAALAGIIIKVFWFKMPRWVSTALYVAMGWSILFDLGSLSAMPSGALTLLAVGGVVYTAGGLIYAFKRPNLFRAFGFHELFHICVILGSLAHFLVIILYIL